MKTPEGHWGSRSKEPWEDALCGTQHELCRVKPLHLRQSSGIKWTGIEKPPFNSYHLIDPPALDMLLKDEIQDVWGILRDSVYSPDWRILRSSWMRPYTTPPIHNKEHISVVTFLLSSGRWHRPCGITQWEGWHGNGPERQRDKGIGELTGDGPESIWTAGKGEEQENAPSWPWVLSLDD